MEDEAYVTEKLMKTLHSQTETDIILFKNEWVACYEYSTGNASRWAGSLF